jgi:hypothetical protein
MRLLDKLLNWFYSTRLGGLYFDFLLWKDRTYNSTQYLTPGEIQQIIKQCNQISEGVEILKRKINNLVTSKSKEEYERVLGEIEDLIPYAARELDPEKEKLMQLLQKAFKKNIDIVTATDRAKMIDKRINDMYELQRHIEQRNLLRTIRKLRSENNIKEAEKLEEEWKNKYGRFYSRSRNS